MDSCASVMLPAEMIQTCRPAVKRVARTDPIPCGLHVSALVAMQENERWPLVYYRAQKNKWVGPMHLLCEQLPVGHVAAIGEGAFDDETFLVSVEVVLVVNGVEQYALLSFRLPGTRYFFGGDHAVVTWSFWAMKAFAANHRNVSLPPTLIMAEFDMAEQCNVGFQNAQRRLCAVSKRKTEREIESDDLLAFLRLQQESFGAF